MNVHLIAIVGGSGSGKTWLGARLQEQFGEDAAGLSLDHFYRDLSHLPEAERNAVNFDDPAAIDWPLFRHSVSRIRCGQPIELPDYDYGTHTRRPAANTWHPRRLVLLDGLWLLRESDLRALYSLSVFVECPEEVRLARRLKRDQHERCRSAQAVRAQFRRHVAPMHDRFVAPQVQHADLVVYSRAGSAMLSELRAVLGRLLQPEERTV